MKIAIAKRSHVQEIVKIWKEFMDFHARLDPIYRRSRNGHSHFERHLMELMASDDARVLVAAEGTRVLGYAVAEIRKRPPVFKDVTYGLVSDLAVMARYRRGGLGSKLLRAVLRWFRSNGIRRIHVRVAAKNTIANSFWRKRGFQDHMHELYLKG